MEADEYASGVTSYGTFSPGHSGHIGSHRRFAEPKRDDLVLLQAVRRGRLTPLATPSLFLEYEEVMKRPEQRELSNLSLADVDWVLKRPGGHVPVAASAVAPATA